MRDIFNRIIIGLGEYLCGTAFDRIFESLQGVIRQRRTSPPAFEDFCRVSTGPDGTFEFM